MGTPVSSPGPEDHELAVRPLIAGETDSLLRAILRACDYGVLLTDLEHRSLACNRTFGELFAVSPMDAVTCEVDELRRRVLARIKDPAAWLAGLHEIYRDPERSHEDDLHLVNPDCVLRRATNAVRSADGEIIGRLWTFRDVTRERRLLRIHQVLHEVTTVYDPDPHAVYRRILDAISKLYDDSTAILSIQNGDFMEFKVVAGPRSRLHKLPGNPVKDSYCQFALQSVQPKVVQNARKDPELVRIRPSRAGLTRYLGVPVRDEEGGAIGTLCILDDKSDQPLDEQDVQFMSLVAVRVNAELARERHLRDRLAEKDAAIRQKQEDLSATVGVLEAMNAAFALLGVARSPEEMLREQASLLRDQLGYSSAAVLVRPEGATALRGFTAGARSRRVTAAEISVPDVLAEGPVRFGTGRTAPLGEVLQADHFAYAARHTDGVGWVLIAMGRPDAPPEHDRRHTGHLEALVEQVRLLVSTHRLQSQLLETHAELSSAQDRLLQSEKLSVVGTLAASTAHDIRNILSSLSMLVAPGMGDPEEALVAVREQIDRFNVLAHRLMSYAKPRMVDRQPVAMRALIERVLALTSAQLRVNDVRVTARIPADLPEIIGDPHQLEHLFVNLVLNAVHAMERGGSLTLSGVVRGDTIQLRVSDTGHGIPRHIADRLFEPFASSRAEGTGLGLYSCRRIVEAHGGTIEARRNPVRGTTFTICLPTGKNL